MDSFDDFHGIGAFGAECFVQALAEGCFIGFAHGGGNFCLFCFAFGNAGRFVAHELVYLRDNRLFIGFGGCLELGVEVGYLLIHAANAGDCLFGISGFGIGGGRSAGGAGRSGWRGGAGVGSVCAFAFAGGEERERYKSGKDIFHGLGLLFVHFIDGRYCVWTFFLQSGLQRCFEGFFVCGAHACGDFSFFGFGSGEAFGLFFAHSLHFFGDSFFVFFGCSGFEFGVEVGDAFVELANAVGSRVDKCFLGVGGWCGRCGSGGRRCGSGGWSGRAGIGGVCAFAFASGEKRECYDGSEELFHWKCEVVNE